MKVISPDPMPKIFVDFDVAEKIKLFAKNMTKRGMILCDCVMSSDGVIEIVNCFLPEQTVDYVKNECKYEEINPYIGYKDDENYGTVYCQCMIRNNLQKTRDEFNKTDFNYFAGLCEVSDWIIIGEVCKDDSVDYPLTLWYYDIDRQYAYGFLSPGEKGAGYDGNWKVGYSSYISEEDVKREIKNNCKEKSYSYGSYGSYSNKTNNSSYYGGKGGTYSSTNTVKKQEKSELNKNDPDIFSLVSESSDEKENKENT